MPIAGCDSIKSDIDHFSRMASCIHCGQEIPPAATETSDVSPQNACAQCLTASTAAATSAGEAGAATSHGIAFSPTTVLIGINLLVFAAMVLSGVSFWSPDAQQLTPWGANLGPLTILENQWWRLFTSLFLHVGILHLLLNMWCLWNLGALGEPLYGPWRFVAVYLLSGLGGSVASLARTPLTASAGASGAIFGLAGALIATFKLGRLPFSAADMQSTLRSLLAFAGYNLLFGLVSGRIDNGAHVGGLVTGFVLGAALSLDFRRLDSQHAEGRQRPLAALLAVPLAVGVIAASAQYVREFRAPDIRLGLGERALARGDAATAVREFQAAIELKPEVARTHQQLAMAYAISNQRPRAIQELERTLKLDPENISVRKQLAGLYLVAGRRDAATEMLAEAAGRNPPDAEVLYGLGVLLQQAGKHEKAVSQLQKSAGLQPNSAPAQQALGVSLLALERYDEALPALEKASKLAPENPDVLMMLSNAYEAKGMTKQADDAYLRAYSLRHAQPKPN